MRPESLFLATALAHAALAGYTYLRIRRRAPVPIEEREAFTSHAGRARGDADRADARPARRAGRGQRGGSRLSGRAG